MVLTIYVDPISQPSRALMIFLKSAGIPHEVETISLLKGENKTPEYAAISKKQQVPCIKDGDFVLSETTAIFRYLLSTRENVPDHWYPGDVKAQARVDEFLSWLPTGLRKAGIDLFLNAALFPMLGVKPLDEKVVEEKRTDLRAVLVTMETFYLCEGHDYLGGADQMSVADLWGATELDQPLSTGYNVEADHPRLFVWYNKVKSQFSDWDEVKQGVTDIGATYINREK